MKVNPSKDKIRVLTVVRNPLGGIRTYLKYTYGALPKDKYQFTILMVRESEQDSLHLREDLESRGCDVKITEVQGKTLHLRLLWNIVKSLAKDRYDLIHSQGFTAGIITSIGNALFGVPHILTPHSMLREEDVKPPFRKVKKWMLGILFGRASVIQSVGEDAQANLIQFLPRLVNRTDKLEVIKNGINVELFAEKRKESHGSLRKDLGIRDDQFVFGYLGRFMPEKGFDYLIGAVEAISDLRDFTNKFRVLALNDGDYIKSYRRKLKESGLEGYIVFYGFVPDVGRIIKQLDAVVMPSLSEAYSLVPIESFIMGCPVIATKCVGLREVVADSPALMAEPGDADSLAGAMVEFMRNADSIKEKAKAFVNAAEVRYDIQHTARRLDALFGRVSGSKCSLWKPQLEDGA